MSLLYLGGCILGDVVDKKFDSIHRPNRPLPNGIIKAPTALMAAILFLAIGWFLTLASYPIHLILFEENGLSFCSELFHEKEWAWLFPADIVKTSSLLCLCILAYALFHKKMGKGSPILMAACRSLLVLTVIVISLPNLYGKGMAWPTPWIFIPVVAVGLYTYLLSTVAATESSPKPYSRQKLLGSIFVCLPIFAIGLFHAYQFSSQSILRLADTRYDLPLSPPSYLLLASALLIYMVWSLRAMKHLNHSKPTFVSHALAGFCLLDACIAATFSIPAAVICFGLFGLALLLQKIAPAT